MKKDQNHKKKVNITKCDDAININNKYLLKVNIFSLRNIAPVTINIAGNIKPCCFVMAAQEIRNAP